MSDKLTITNDPLLEITRSESGDIHINTGGEGVTVPQDAIHPLQAALEAFKATPADTRSVPPGLRDAMQEENDSECPECGSELVHEMGSDARQCPNCEWSE